MRKFKRFVAATLAFALTISNESLLSIGPFDIDKPMSVFAATVHDAYDAYNDLKDAYITSGSAINKLNAKTNASKGTRIDTAGDVKSPDMAGYWKLKDSVYKNGIYNGFFTFQQKDIDAAAQVKSGDWLNKSFYEAMAGTPTTEDVFVNMGGSQWIADLQYRVTECTYVRKYHFNASVANYRFYDSGDIESYSWYKYWPLGGGRTVTPEPTPYNVSPQPWTLGNWEWCRLEQGNDTWTTNKDQFKETLVLGIQPYKAWKRDKFGSSGREYDMNRAITDDMSPNQSMVLSIKKAVKTHVEDLKSAYDGITNNYRWDEGMWDANKDGTDDHIGWMYTYSGMVRKSTLKGDGGSGKWYHPYITSYFFDWDNYTNYGGVSSSTPADNIEYYTLGEVTGKDDDNLRYWLATAADFSGDMLSKYFPLNPNAGLPFILNTNADYMSHGVPSNRTLYFMYDCFIIPPNLLMGFCKPSKFLAFGYPIKGASYALTESETGSLFDLQYNVGPFTIDFNSNGFNETAYWYYYSIYYFFLMYGWMFYPDEISALWGGLPGAEPSSVWTVPTVNKLLGIVFSNEDAYATKFQFSSLSALIRVPYAIYPRGGDLDGRMGVLGSRTQFSSAIEDLVTRDIIFPGLNNLDYVYYDEYSLVADMNTFTYPAKIYCIEYHPGGVHCPVRNGTKNDGECTGQPHTPCGIPPLTTKTHGSGCDVSGHAKTFTYKYGCAGAIYYDHSDTYTTASACGDDHGLCDGCPVCNPPPPSTEEDESSSSTTPTCTCKCTYISACNQTTVQCHGDHHTHFEGDDDEHCPQPWESHEDRYYHEFLMMFCNMTASRHRNTWSPQRSMGDSQIIGQKFKNVQWLDLDSFQIWMLNKGYSKGLAYLLAQPVTIDNECSIIETAVTNQLGYTFYDIDDALTGQKENNPSNGKTTLPGEVRNLQLIGRVANSFNRYSKGNCKSNAWTIQSPGSPHGVWGQRINVLSYLNNDVPGIRTGPADAAETASGARAVGHVNGDFHAYKYDTSNSLSGNDDLYFVYNPYAQGGRSDLNFDGFINQGLAHTLYYCTTGDFSTPDPRPVKTSTKVAYSNSIRIMGDFLAIDYAYKGTAKTLQQPLLGYMYDTWRERDDGFSDYSGGQFRLVKDNKSDGCNDLAKYNCRCAWVPASLSYLLGRAPWDIVVNSDAITSNSNSWIIHTFCLGINGGVHSCWDSINGDAYCTSATSTVMGDITSCHGIVSLRSLLLPGAEGDCNVINLKYFDNKKPYDLISEAFRNGAEYYDKADGNSLTKGKYNIYAALKTQAPWIGYGADGYDSGGTHEGFKDITKDGSGNTQLGYKIFENKYHFDSNHTYVTPGSSGYNEGFDQFGYWDNHPGNPKPITKNKDKETRGKKADGANKWSEYYPWLQHLNVNRYLANDRYTTGRAALEYESVGHKVDPHLSHVRYNVHTKNEADNPKLTKYFFKNSIDFFKDKVDLASAEYIYVNAAYSPGKLKTLNKDNFKGNPNDIIIYNPVATQSAHIVKLSDYLPDAGNVGTVSKDDTDRNYTKAYLYSFATYVARDTRLVYKHQLDSQVVDNTEQYISSSEIFKQSITKVTTTTTEVIKEVSTIPTTYYTMDDYTGSDATVEKWSSTSFNDSYTIHNSDTFDLTFFQSKIGNTVNGLSTSLHLESGDKLYFDNNPGTGAVILDMVDAGLSVPWSNFQKAYKLSTVSNFISQTDATESIKNETLVSTFESISNLYSTLGYSSAVDYVNMVLSAGLTTTADTDTYFESAFSNYFTSIGKDFDDLPQVKTAVHNYFNKILEEAGCNIDLSSEIPLKTDDIMSIGTSGLPLRAGQLVHITLKSDRSNAFTLQSSDTASYSLHAQADGNTYKIFIEAHQDTTLSDIVVKVNLDNKLQYRANALSYDPTVLMNYSNDVNTLITNVSSYDYWYSNMNYSHSTSSASLFLNGSFLHKRTDISIAAWGDFTVRGLYLGSEAGNSDPVLSGDAQSDPHKVPNSNWKYYVLGWRTADGSMITSINDPRLSDGSTKLLVPSGTAYFPTGFVLVQDLISKVGSGTLGIYKGWDGNYGLIDLYMSGGKLTYDRVSKYTGYEITEGTFAYIDFTEDGSGTRIEKEVWDASAFVSADISQYIYEAVFKCTSVDAITYDVAYSKNSAHKVTEDNANYYEDYKVVEQTNVLFTGEAYDAVFAKALSLDDEFTIYWDNFTDLYNKNGMESKKKNLKGVSVELGKGWDNYENAQKHPITKRNEASYPSYNHVKKYDFWKKATDTTLLTDTTKWIYNKYLIFNVDMYAFTEGDSYVYDDTKGTAQIGDWDPTTPAYKEDGTPNSIVYIPAGQKVYLGYYMQRDTDLVIGTSDNCGRFIDYGYNCYFDDGGNVHKPTGYDGDNKPTGGTTGTKDPNKEHYTYHFWCPLSNGEAYDTATVQFVVNGINSVDDMDEDANYDHVVDNKNACTDNSKSTSRTIGNTSLSAGTTSNYTPKYVPSTLKRKNQMTASSASTESGFDDNEWDTKYITAFGFDMSNNVRGISGATVTPPTVKFKYADVYRRYVSSVTSQTTSIVGRVGGFTILDTGDPRWQDSFKVSAPDAPFAITPFVKLIDKYSNVKGEPGSQFRYMTDTNDVRGRVIFKDTSNVTGDYVTAESGDTYSWNKASQSQSSAWHLSTANIANHYAINDWSGVNVHEEMVNEMQTVKVGYTIYCSMQTIGNIYGSRDKRPDDTDDSYVNLNGDYGQTKIQIHPMYTAINTETGEIVAVDAYMRNGNSYACINAGSEYASEVQANADGSSDKGPYYLTTTYANKYTLGNETNTAGENGNTYNLDQSMLRYAITSKEAEITHRVVKEIAPSRDIPDVKNGITTTILDYFDYSDMNNLGGLALDDTYAYGNGQMLFLRELNRTFIGGTSLALKQKTSNDAYVKSMLDRAGMYAQKWYFGFSLPSSTVFVRHGDKVKQSTILTYEQNWYILCTVDIYVIGEKWAYQYETNLSQSDIKIEDKTIHADKWNVYKKKFPHAFPVCIYNLNKQQSTTDLDTQGSH